MFVIELRADQADDEAPDCPQCSSSTRQEFQPIAIAGVKAGNRAAATALAETIAREDYGVEDMTIRTGEHAKVRYKDRAPESQPPSTWIGPNMDMLNAGLREGAATRRDFGGSGLDVLQANLNSGAQPDLIALSKRRSMKVW